MVLTATPCLITHSNNQVNRKRKRSAKSVRFDVDQNVIIDTYSPMDYDRGSVFSFPPVLYKINPIILNNSDKQQQPSLSLEIPSSPCDSEDSSPETEESCNIPLIPTTTSTNKKKKPKLSVDTSICAGPLFFTSLSTNHVRHKVNDTTDDDDDDDSKNDYLVPISAI
jgi:hypothetical protein